LKTRTVVVSLLTLTMLVAIAVVPAAAYTYDRQAAANYAYNNAYNNVPWSWFYNSHDGDCTNFVSHSLQAGGWRETGKYYYWRSSAWYCDWCNNPAGYSRTWGAANNLYRFLGSSGRADQLSVGHPYYPRFKVGDVIQMDGVNGKSANGVWDHTMIVTGIIVSDDDLLVSYHTPNKRNVRFSIIKAGNPNSRFVGWHIRDNY